MHKPKTKTSKRKVYIPGHVIEVMQEYKTWCQENQPYKDDYVVFGWYYLKEYHRSSSNSFEAILYDNNSYEYRYRELDIIQHDETYRGADINNINEQKYPVMAGGEHAWDLITMHDQATATGLYLFTVEDKSSGTIKEGKFLIIK